MRLIDGDELLTAFPVDDEPTLTKSCVRTTIKHMPTIEPEQRWIPCSERPPEESGLYIVTNVGRCGELVETRYYYIREDSNFWGGNQSYKVLAWMPLPKPYKEEIE